MSKFIVHQTMLIDASNPQEAASIAVELQRERRDWPECNKFTVQWVEGDIIKGETVNVPLPPPPPMELVEA